MSENGNDSNLIANRYILHDQLGRGGMGAVYRATDRLTGQVVALKRVTVSAEALEFASESFQGDSIGLRVALAREFQLLASLRHPHIISVLDYGFDDDEHPFFTMNLLEGSVTLSDASEDESLDGRVDLLLQTLQALAYLHRRGIIHRDLKPANILVDNEDEVRVLDFGVSLVRDTSSSQESEEIAGTLAYIAPEVLQGQRVREAADLYAVGVIAYELFTGKHPFDTGNIGQLIHNILTSKPDLSAFSTLDLGAKIDVSGIAGDMATEVMPESVLDDLKERDSDSTKEVAEFAVPDALQDIEDSQATFVADEPIGASSEDDESDAIDAMATITGMPTAKMYETIAPSELEIDITTPIDDISYDSDAIDVPPLAQIIDRLLAKDPSIRYHDAYEVINDLCDAIARPAPEESAAIRESFLQAATFIGRDVELSQLVDALEMARHDNSGSAWLVGGESGMGKTRLLEELRTFALVQGVTVLRGQAVAGGGLPFHAWREPLRRLALTDTMEDIEVSILKDIVPDIEQLVGRTAPEAPEVDASAYQQRLIGTVASIFQRQNRPMLLLIEDLQWLTESLEILKALNGMVGDLPILIVASFRSEDRPDLPDELPAMRVLKLERLSEDNIAALTVSMLGQGGAQAHILDLLQRETEGNVYFLVEVVRALAEAAGRLQSVGQMELPETVVAGGIDAIIQKRLDHVPKADQELLQLAALHGRELDLKLIEALRGKTDLEAWLSICSNSAVIEVTSGDWRFSHDKLRLGAIANIGDAERPDMHRRVAEAIEAVYPDTPEQAFVLAKHWGQAGDVVKERDYSHQAGEYFLQVSAFDEAIACFDRTLELYELQDDSPEIEEIRADLLVKLGEASYWIGDSDSATGQLESGLEKFRRLNLQSGAARALMYLGNVKTAQGEFADAQSNYESSLETYRALDERLGEGMVLGQFANLLVEQGNYDDARPYYQQSLEIARELGDERGVDKAIGGLGQLAFAQGDYAGATNYYQQTLEICRKTGQRHREGTALLNLGAAAGSQEDFVSSMQYFEESVKIMRTVGAKRLLALALDNLGVLAEIQEDFDGAIGYFEQSLDITRSIGNRHAEALTLCNLGNVARRKGDQSEATGFYHEGLKLAYEIEAMPIVMDNLVGLAGVTPDEQQALELLGFALDHPSTIAGTSQEAQPILDALRENLSEDEVEAGLARGKARELDEVVSSILS